MGILKHMLHRTAVYESAFIRWMVLAVIIGILCGVVGTAFHIGVEVVTEFRLEHGWMLYLLPVFGLAITALYKVTKCMGKGTNDVIDAVNDDKPLPLLLVPAIFFGTVLTHAGGGSSGREGAALQMGGTIGYQTGKLCRLSAHEIPICVIAGMAAFFSALFGTPLAATVFALTVIQIGAVSQAAMLPSFMAAMSAYGVSLLLGVEPTHFNVVVPELTGVLFAKVCVLGLLCALVSIIFCLIMHGTEELCEHYLKNAWIKAAVGGLGIIVMTKVFGPSYNGAGLDVVRVAIEQGQASPFAFLLKIVFTAVTLSTGFKGGEVVPSFFAGAAFGCVVGPLLGIPAGFAAAIGLVSVFCGVTNCPLGAIFLAVELFGAPGLACYACGCIISYMMSGYEGLYSRQQVLYSKLHNDILHAYTNHFDGEEENA